MFTDDVYWSMLTLLVKVWSPESGSTWRPLLSQLPWADWTQQEVSTDPWPVLLLGFSVGELYSAMFKPSQLAKVKELEVRFIKESYPPYRSLHCQAFTPVTKRWSVQEAAGGWTFCHSSEKIRPVCIITPFMHTSGHLVILYSSTA